MTVKELKELLKDIPDEADVIIEADHGDHPEIAESFAITRNYLDTEDADDVIYEWEGWRKIYDEDAVAEYPTDGEITGVLISSY